YSYGRYAHIGDYDDNPVPSVVAVDLMTNAVTCGRKVKEKIFELRGSRSHLVVESVKSALASDRFWNTPARAWYAEEVTCELFRSLSERTKEATGDEIRE